MDATAGISWSDSVDSSSVENRPIVWERVRNDAALLFSGLLALAAVFLLARRLAGGLTAPLPTLLLIGVGLIAATAGWAVHVLSPTGCQTQGAASQAIVAQWLAVLALPIFAIAVSLPGSSTFGLTVLWLIIGGAEIGVWRLRKNKRMGTALLLRREANLWALAGSSAGRGQAALIDDPFNSSLLLREAATATQKLVYHRSADGRASVQGWLRANFVPQQRTAIVHVAFCPAFEQAPSVEAEMVDGPSCEIRPTLVLAWGVRWEVKLDAAAEEPMQVVLVFSACER
jgi:hypothetical protein